MCIRDRDQVNIIRRRLPDDADDPILIKVTSGALPVMLVIFKAGPTFPGLYHFVDNDVSKMIQQIPGVGDVSVFGGEPVSYTHLYSFFSPSARNNS